MYNDLDKKFELTAKKALPYLVLAPIEFKKRISELMDGLFHQLLQRSAVDFDAYYAEINDMLDNRKSFESNLEVKVQNFANRFVSQEKTIRVMTEQLVKMEKRAAKSERRIKALENPRKAVTPTEDIHKYPEDIHKYPEDIHKYPEDIHKYPEDIHRDPNDKVLKTPEGYFCGFCETSKLAKKGIHYSKTPGKTFQKYRCSKCGTWFKIDEDGVEIPTKRKKQSNAAQA